MYRARFSMFAFALVLGVPSLGRAQSAESPAPSIAEARERWFEAEFEGSLAGFEAVLANPALTPAEALDAHRFLAALFQVLGDEPGARAHADAAVALDPSAEPPEGAPPQAGELFRMARRRVGGHEATVSVEASAPLALDTPGVVRARVEPSPPSLFARVRLRCGDAEQEDAAPSVELSLVPAGDVACTAAALSAGGAVLRSAHRTFDLEAPADTVAESRGGRRAWPWIVAGSVVAAAAAGTAVGILVLRDRDEPELVGTTVVGW